MLRIFSLALLSAALLAGCQRTATGTEVATTTDCLDPARIDSTGICTMDYNPVCGCNGRTYANPCAAQKAGLLSFKPGPCPAAARP